VVLHENARPGDLRVAGFIIEKAPFQMIEVVAVIVEPALAEVFQMVEAKDGVEFAALVRGEQLVHLRPGSRRFADGKRI
jgi:hypothetical protein